MILSLLASLALAGAPDVAGAPTPKPEVSASKTTRVCLVRDDADSGVVGLFVSARPAPAGTRTPVDLPAGGLLRFEVPVTDDGPVLVDVVAPERSNLYTIYAEAGNDHVFRVRVAPPSRPGGPAVNYSYVDERDGATLFARCRAAPLVPLP